MEQALSNHTFCIPTKQLTTPAELEQFQSSNCKQNLMYFILSLQDSVKNKCRSSTPPTASTQGLLQILDSIDNWIDEFPPLNQPQRYGNKAFKSLQEKIESEGRSLISTLLLTKQSGPLLLSKEADLELNTYLSQSFGDPTRIDYGTGHELNFLSFLLCLFLLNYLADEDRASVVHTVFWRYMIVMRKIQDTYKLEPAGSHGVWGLDDYHFLPFLFGASELLEHKEYTPHSIHDDYVIDREKGELLYFHCVYQIKAVKSGHFGEHSPMLNDISGVSNWGKVAQGMIKMYKNEVLNKHPVMKHFLFGSLITNG